MRAARTWACRGALDQVVELQGTDAFLIRISHHDVSPVPDVSQWPRDAAEPRRAEDDRLVGGRGLETEAGAMTWRISSEGHRREAACLNDRLQRTAFRAAELERYALQGDP